MKKIFIFTICVFAVGGLSAQSKKSLREIDKELKQTKSTATAEALIEQIGEVTPQTDADVATLGQLMDKYPTQGQKALVGIKDPKLAKAVMQECDRQVVKMKAIRAKSEASLTDTDKQDYLDGYMNSSAAIDTLSRLDNKDALPLLRGYLQDEDLSRLASIALGRLGDTESLEGMLNNIENRKGIDLSGYGDKGMVRVVEELDKPGIEPKRKYALIDQIKGSRSPERKRMLKDLALNHKDAGVRDRSGLALLNSIMVNPEAADKAFISEWVNKTKNDESGYWAVDSIGISLANSHKQPDGSTTALLLDVLKTSTYKPTRQVAARSIGEFKLTAALPYLEECIRNDKDEDIRGDCQLSYWQISGTIPPIFTEKDAKYFEGYINKKETIDFYNKLNNAEPVKKRYLAKIKALNEYRRTHK